MKFFGKNVWENKKKCFRNFVLTMSTVYEYFVHHLGKFWVKFVETFYKINVEGKEIVENYASNMWYIKSKYSENCL